MDRIVTVGDWLERLKMFPWNWQVIVATPAGGGITIEHREINGEAVVAVFGTNGGRFGENPLTEEEYEKRSREFLSGLDRGGKYTSMHGDHRIFYGEDSCYGTNYDDRIIERMVKEGILEYYKIPYSRDGVRRKLAMQGVADHDMGDRESEGQEHE